MQNVYNIFHMPKQGNCVTVFWANWTLRFKFAKQWMKLKMLCIKHEWSATLAFPKLHMIEDVSM